MIALLRTLVWALADRAYVWALYHDARPPRRRRDYAGIAIGVLTAVLFAVVVATMLALSGCATMQTVREDIAHGDGDARDYAATEAHAIEASREVLRGEGASVIEDDRAAGCLWATFPGGFWATETNVGVCFHALDGGRERVTVVSRRHQQTAAFTRLTEGGFHERLAARLARGDR